MSKSINVPNDELYHWKYVKREKVNGKWKYWYDEESLKRDTKTTLTNTANAAVKKVNNVTSGVDSLVQKAKNTINNFLNDKDNTYVVNSSNYKQKIEKIKETQEWKDIVARKDSEYVKRNSDGTTTYLVDDYLVDKKHPVLDMLGDIAAGRKVDTNEITLESTVAGLKDYATSAINKGMLAVGIASTWMTEKFKFQQGSYDDKVRELRTTVENGIEYVDEVVGYANDAADYINKGSEYLDDVKVSAPTVNEADIALLLSIADRSTNASQSKKAVDEGNVVRAVQVLMESDAMKAAVGDNEYYQIAEQCLAGLSEEEVAMINLLVRELRS